MVPTPDLMRALLFVLEGRQVSPRATVLISIEDEAAELETDPGLVASGLDSLLGLDYIDGPGPDESGYWMFRKITRKGVEFIRATRNPRDWEKMKAKFADPRLARQA